MNAPPSPLVERQTYIISSSIAALRETITEKGITNKHVLSMNNYDKNEKLLFLNAF